MIARLIVVSVLLLLPERADAFSDPVLFARGIAEGGGSGRYFTGSRADRYACSACHHGASPARFDVEGIPDRLVAGQRYELVVSWDATDPDAPSALQLEMTSAGMQPSVEVPAVTALPASARCGQKDDGEPAVYTVDTGARRIVGVEDCGASSITVSFVARDVPIELAISGVRSDGSGTPDGDGTYELRTTIGDPWIATGGGGCTTSRGDGGWLLAVGLALMAARRRPSR